jgi:hypothetical protein
MGLMRHFVGIWLLLQLLLSPAQLSAGQTLTGLQQYAHQLADSRLFAGMVHVEQGKDARHLDLVLLVLFQAEM